VKILHKQRHRAPQRHAVPYAAPEVCPAGRCAAADQCAERGTSGAENRRQAHGAVSLLPAAACQRACVSPALARQHKTPSCPRHETHVAVCASEAAGETDPEEGRKPSAEEPRSKSIRRRRCSTDRRCFYEAGEAAIVANHAAVVRWRGAGEAFAHSRRRHSGRRREAVRRWCARGSTARTSQPPFARLLVERAVREEGKSASPAHSCVDGGINRKIGVRRSRQQLRHPQRPLNRARMQRTDNITAKNLRAPYKPFAVANMPRHAFSYNHAAHSRHAPVSSKAPGAECRAQADSGMPSQS